MLRLLQLLTRNPQCLRKEGMTILLPSFLIFVYTFFFVFFLYFLGAPLVLGLLNNFQLELLIYIYIYIYFLVLLLNVACLHFVHAKWYVGLSNNFTFLQVISSLTCIF